jgi:hypothetical protein
VFNGPPDARSDGRARSSLTDTSDFGGEPAEPATFTDGSTPDPNGTDIQHHATPSHTDALSITVAKVRDRGLADLIPGRLRTSDGNPDRSVGASASYRAATPSSVFIVQSDTGSALPAYDYTWPADTAARAPKPSGVSAAHPVLSASVSRQGANPTYADVLAALP